MTSKYGKGLYGVNHYSRVAVLDLSGDLAPVAAFLASVDIVGQDFFDGDFAPIVTFSGALGLVFDVVPGDFVPTVVFAADLTFDLLLGGDLDSQIDLEGSLILDSLVDGDLSFTVIFAASGFIVGPLWTSEICSPVMWTSEICPPVLWTPDEPCDLATWEESELCNG